MKTKTEAHTLGPWRNVGQDVYGATYDSGGNPKRVARTINPTIESWGEATANSRLIAAAPDLLSAAKRAYALIESETTRPGHDDKFVRTGTTCEECNVVIALGKAIAKAEGR